MTSVAVLGASGFVGAAVCAALERRGATVMRVAAPRLTTGARDRDGLLRDLDRLQAQNPEIVDGLTEATRQADVVVNAAGAPSAGSGDTDALFGANALLPGLLGSVLDDRGDRPRLVHVSSAAVHGRAEVLHDHTSLAPFSPYSASKVLGEQVLGGRPGVVLFRPTSVHGAGRPTTALMRRVCASPFASVAGPGDGTTPQVLVDNVGDALAFVSLTTEALPAALLQPWEGLTVSGLVRVLGRREPRHVPIALAGRIRDAAFGAARRRPAVAGHARRLEMLWFGQAQAPGWLDARWSAPVGLEGWQQLAHAARPA